MKLKDYLTEKKLVVYIHTTHNDFLDTEEINIDNITPENVVKELKKYYINNPLYSNNNIDEEPNIFDIDKLGNNTTLVKMQGWGTMSWIFYGSSAWQKAKKYVNDFERDELKNIKNHDREG